jgi:DNA-cytosine methyltransferase
MRHASFFSGVGGLDLGFERAGIKTVSVCEIDPYASSVLAERFRGAPNLGNITEVSADDIPEADIWSGGFPCQDLSTAGKRAGFAGKRSSLAFTFLDLVEQRKPRWLVLENVPGLFTSNKGADFARLLHEMEQLGYGVAWRTLDARYFGVPQRRRRVFLVASLESDRSAEVLFECEGCERHPQPRWAQGKDVANGTQGGLGVDSRRESTGKSSPSTDADGMREADGLARRVDNQPVVAYQTRVDEKNNNFTLNEVQVANSLSAMWPADTSHRSMTLVRAFRKSSRAQTSEDSETWVEGDVANTINSFDVGDVRTTHAVVGSTDEEDATLSTGLDSNRYRCCGNGVVSNVAEWIGHRLKLQHDNW